MKKTIALILMVVLCLALAVPAFAAAGDEMEATLSPSNPVPEYVHDKACLSLVSYADADKLPEAEKEELLMVWNALNDGSMTLPYDKFEGVDPEKMVIRDLMDVSYFCGSSCTENHAEELKKEGVTAEITFKLGVEADDVVVVMYYFGGEWVPAQEITNNGDGSVTVVCEDLCPFVIAVEY